MPNRLPRSRTLKGEPKLAYFDSGEARPGEAAIVLLHGRFFRSEDWENIFQRLATRYRVIAYDARGHGRSGRAERYDFHLLVEDALRVVRDVVRGPAMLIGHSLGALTALVAATRAPELVRALVLEEPPLGLFGAPWDGPFFTGLRASLERVGQDAAFRRAVARLPLLAPGPRGERTIGDVRGFYDVERMVLYYGVVDPAFVQARIAAADEIGHGVVQSALPLVHQPSLLLVGDPREGAMTTEQDIARLTAAISDCKVVRFPRVGHRIHGLRPEPFIEALEPFLRRVRAG